MHSSIVLKHLGIEQWHPRKLQHPWYQQNKIIVDVMPAIFQVKCMVILAVADPGYSQLRCSAWMTDNLTRDNSEKTTDNLTQYDLGKTAETSKILTGMLGVLNLTPKEISIARIYHLEQELTDARIHHVEQELTAQDWQQIMLEVNAWQPQFILLLANTAEVLHKDKRITQIFSPQYLAANPKDKARAYKDLLTLKEKLHCNAYLT